MSDVKRPDPDAPAARPYRSPRRAAQARATRAAVIAAARSRFLEVGYHATTVDAVAAAADVSAATVYGTFGSKRGLLAAVIDEAVVGDADAVALADRAWIEDVARADTAAARLALLYERLREVYERTADLDRLLEEAAAGDPTLADLRADHLRRQREDTERFRRLVIGGGVVFHGLTDQQDVDALQVLGGQEVYRRLTGQCGWPPELWARWMTELTSRLVEPGDASPESPAP
ncbi:MAG: TetR family transcriptional regulator [Acidimicrobiia bacterium]